MVQVLAQQPLRAQASGRSAVRAGVSRKAVVVRAAKTANGPTLAVVGITGAVGQEFLTVGLVAAAGNRPKPKPTLLRERGPTHRRSFSLTKCVLDTCLARWRRC